MPIPALLKLQNHSNKHLTGFFLAVIMFISLAGSVGLFGYNITHLSDSPDAINYRIAMSILLLVIGIALGVTSMYILK